MSCRLIIFPVEGSVADLKLREQVTLIKSFMVKGLGESAHEIDIHTIDGFQVPALLPQAASFFSL